jgi:hypothetical protein
MVGLFPMALDWAEFDLGSVRSTLNESGLFSTLPGSEASSEVAEAIVNMYPSMRGDEVRRFEMVSERDARPGLPLDLYERLIQVERFHYLPGLEEEQSRNQLSGFRAALEEAIAPGEVVEILFETFDVMGRRAARASLTWKPAGPVSSRQAFARAEKTILKAFDAAMPRRPGLDLDYRGTYAVLCIDGRLYFESSRD